MTARSIFEQTRNRRGQAPQPGPPGPPGAAGAPGPTPTILALASDFVSSATTLSSVTGMAIAALANEVWLIEVFGRYSAPVTTTGAGIALQIPTGATINGIARIRQGGDGTDAFFEYSLDVSDKNVVNASNPVAGSAHIVQLRALVVIAATAGDIQLRWRSEVSGSAATLLAGTRMIATKLS